MTTPDSTNPELAGLDPGELLTRGIHTVRPSGPVHDWTPPSPEELARLLPQYRIESLIGRGGMGAVYKGFQEKLGRPVAIKLLPAELTADEQFVTRFEREARTLAKLHHPGIVAIHDFGQTPDGHLYFVMEYVEGTDLRRILQGPGLEPGQALEIITQICEALHAAHQQGVIHRDIKPANILLTTGGRVKLADFGLARPDREEQHEALTLSNVALGTPDYMAPEQREGRSDPRADIYALGVMLYEMLTGQLPCGAWAPPSRKVQVDVRIDEVVLKALQQEPDLRYQQASEMKTDVDTIRSGPAASTPAPKPPRRLAWAALIAVLALAVGVAFWFAGKSRSVPTSGENFQAPARTGGEFAKLQSALLSSQWKYVTKRATYSFERTMLFLKDGTAWLFDDTKKRKWAWTITGPKEARLTCEDRAIELTFDDSLAKFTGWETGENQPWGETAFESLQTTPLTEESRNQILEKLKNVADQSSWPKPLDPSVLNGVAGPRKVYDFEGSTLAAGERALYTSVGRGNSDILYGDFSPTKSNLALVVRWTVKPALLPEWLRKKSGENSVFEWVQFPHEGEKNTVTIEPAGLANDDNHDNDTLSARFTGAKGIPFFVSEKIPWRDITEVTQKTYGDQVVITYDHGSGDARETWLKVEVLAVAPDDIWDTYPGMYRSGNVAKFYIDGKDAAKPDEATGAKTSGHYEPPLLAHWQGKLLHTRQGPDEYGLTKDVYSAARGSMGLLVRWTFVPALMDKWQEDADMGPDTTHEAVFVPYGNNADPFTVTLIHGNPVWHETNVDKNGNGGYTVRLQGRNGETLLRFEKKPRLGGIETGDKDHAVWNFQRGDKIWLKVEITALTAEELKAKYPGLKTVWRGPAPEDSAEPASEVAKESSPATQASANKPGPAGSRR